MAANILIFLQGKKMWVGIGNEDLIDVSAIVDYEYEVGICNEAHGADSDWSSVLNSHPYIVHYVL